MKKSVIITIFVIYIFGIFAVGFLGAELKVFDQIVYAEKIECKTEGFIPYDPNTEIGQSMISNGYIGSITKSYQEGLQIELKCQIVPADVTDKKINYTTTKTDVVDIIPNADGTAIIKFKRDGTADILITTGDERAKVMILLRATNF